MNRTDQKLKGGNGLRDRWKMGSNECKQRKFYSRRDGVGWGCTYVLHLTGWARRRETENGKTKHQTLAVFDLSECALSSGISQPWSWRRFRLHLGRCWLTFMWSVSGMCLWYSCCTGCVRWWHWV